MRLTALWWWIDRWRKSTAYTDMTLEEQGAYRNLLDEAHLRGGALPNDERILGKACGDQLAWSRVRANVMARFTLECDGWHHAERLNSPAPPSPRLELRARRKDVPLWIRRFVLTRDEGRCRFCGSIEAPELDHVVPHSVGGPDTIDNLRVLCRPCNRRRGARTETV